MSAYQHETTLKSAYCMYIQIYRKNAYICCLCGLYIFDLNTLCGLGKYVRIYKRITAWNRKYVESAWPALVTYSAQEPKTWFLKCLMIDTKQQMRAMFKLTHCSYSGFVFKRPFAASVGEILLICGWCEIHRRVERRYPTSLYGRSLPTTLPNT